jgi:hypothetical protein
MEVARPAQTFFGLHRAAVKSPIPTLTRDFLKRMREHPILSIAVGLAVLLVIQLVRKVGKRF